jgi:hypothetical protein
MVRTKEMRNKELLKFKEQVQNPSEKEEPI